MSEGAVDSFQGSKQSSCSTSRVASPVVFTAATVALYHAHKEDQYQDRVLLGGITLGTIIGMGIGRDLYDTIMKIMPWTILLSLLCSICLHKLLNKKHRGRWRSLGSGSDNSEGSQCKNSGRRV